MPKNNNKSSKLPSVLKGGYNAAVLKRIEETKIPDKIRCEACKKPKTSAVSFSKKQILDLKNGIRSGRIKEKDVAAPLWITCIDCTPKARTEMVCIQCQTWKDLDGFTKVQRRTPEAAVCKMCVFEIANSDPMAPSGVEQLKEMDRALSSDDDDKDSEDSNPWERSDAGDIGSGAPVSGPSSRLNDENLRGLTGKEPATPNAWQTFATEAEKSSAKGKGKEFTAWDASGNAHRVVHAPSVADTEDSWTTVRTRKPTDKDILTKAFSKIQKQMTSKFAKIGATPSAAVAPTDYVGGRPVDSDLDDSDDDSDDSFGYI